MSKLIGDRKFYRKALTVAVPIMIQNGITNFVSLLDNLMIGRVGTEPMSGVAIVNQLMFVIYLGIFGALAGPGIYGAQFYGKGDHEGVRNTFRYKIYITGFVVLIGIAVLFRFGDPLMKLYLHEEGGTLQSVDEVLRYGREYLAVTDGIPESPCAVISLPIGREDTGVRRIIRPDGKTAITSEPMYSNEAIMSFRDKHLVPILPDYSLYPQFQHKYKNILLYLVHL